MTASVNILRGDLHLAVSTAFNRGRYVLMTGGGDGQPIEITIDLRERPDDLFDEAPEDFGPLLDRLAARTPFSQGLGHTVREAPRREDIGKWRPFTTDPHEVRSPVPERHHPDVEPAVYEAMRQVKGERRRASLVWQALGLYAHETGAAAGANVLDWFTAKMEKVSESAYTTDDHGAAIPAQSVRQNPQPPTGPIVYEFAVGDITHGPLHQDLSTVELGDAPDRAAAESADWVHVYDRVTRERRTLKRPEADAVLTGLRDVAADLRRPIPFAYGKTTGRVAGDYVIERGAPVEPPFGCAPVCPLAVGDRVVNNSPNSNGDRGTVLSVKNAETVVVQFDTASGTADLKVSHLDRVDSPPAV